MEMQELTPQFIRDKNGKKTFVILPVEEYDDLLEDLYDLSVIAERRDEPRISLEEFAMYSSVRL